MGAKINELEEQAQTTTGVAFERKNPLTETEDPYKLPVYEADVEYDDKENASNDLNVSIIYKIGLLNNSNNLYGKINKIKEYYSPELQFVDKKVYLDEECSQELVGAAIENEALNVPGTIYGQSFTYNTFDINFARVQNNENILSPHTDGNHVKYVYIKMNLPKSSFYKLRNGNYEIYEGENFRNFAEISSYTTYSKDSNGNMAGLYAAFDYNSVPNTITTTNAKLKSREDDDDMSRGLKIVDSGKRTISGVVFKDDIVDTSTEEDEEKKKTLYGDGQRTAGEAGVANVTVQLVPISMIESYGNLDDSFDQSVDRYASYHSRDPKYANVHTTGAELDISSYYTSKGIVPDKLTVTTDEDGKFTLEGFVPGDYQIRYIWGADKGTYYKDKSGNRVNITTAGYKSTSYNRVMEKPIKAVQVPEDKWFLPAYYYKNRTFISGCLNTPQAVDYSEAVDSWQERLNIDNSLTTTFEDYNMYTDEVNTKTNMNSWTRVMKIGIESVGNLGNEDDCNIQVQEGVEKYDFNISSIDFGLIERPKQQLSISKELKKLRIIDSQDRVIVEAEVIIDENGKKTFKNIEDVLYTVLLPDSNTNPSGLVKSEIDNDYMPITVEATFNISITATGKNDYMNTVFYYYGPNSDGWTRNPVTINPTGVYDYVSDKYSLITTDEARYTMINKDDYKNAINNSTNTNTKLYSTSESGSNTVVEGAYNDEQAKNINDKQYSVLKSVFDEWDNSGTTAREAKLNGKNILDLKGLVKNGGYKAGDIESLEYTVTAVIQSQGDKDTRLDNDVEIVNISKTENYGNAVIESYKPLYDKSQGFVITPPTGENRETLNTEENNNLAVIIISKA